MLLYRVQVSTPDYYPDREEALSPEGLTAILSQGEGERSPHSPLLQSQPAEQLSLERPKSIEESPSCISDTRGNEDPIASEAVGACSSWLAKWLRTRVPEHSDLRACTRESPSPLCVLVL